MDPHTGFTILDYAVFGVMLVSGLLAVFSGFVREIYSLFNWAVSAYITSHFYRALQPMVKRLLDIGNPRTADYVAIFALFCISFIFFAVIGMLIRRILVPNPALTAVDRSLGFVFGLARGFIIVAALYLVAGIALWPGMDKPAITAAVTHDEPGEIVKPPAKTEDAKQSATMSPPAWIANARTRPLLVMGADMLHEFIPEKLLEKTTQDYLQKKDDFSGKVDGMIVDRKNLPSDKMPEKE